MKRPTTNDQRFYRAKGQMKAEIDICPTDEDPNDPPISQCRHAVLQLRNYGNGYVVYDRLLQRIINGVFYGDLKAALQVANLYNKDPESGQDMAPNGSALGLVYPDLNMEDDDE